MNSLKPIAAAWCLALLQPNAGMQAAEPTIADGKVHQIKIVADKAPDCSSLKSIVASVTRSCKTNDEKAIALYNFMQLTHYHQGYPSEKNGLGALKEINVYGWSLCGGLHTIEAALWREAGWPWRYVGWSNPGHTTVEVQYDGRWHYLDSFLKFYAWMADPNVPGGRTIAGEDDIRADPKLVSEGLEFDRSRGVYYHKGNKFENFNDKANWQAPSFLLCGDEPDGILTGVRSSNRSGSPTGWAGLEFDSPGYKTDVDLAVGSSLTLTWDAVKDAHWWNGRKYVPGHGCGDKDYRNCPAIGPICEPYQRSGGQRRSYANGTLLYEPDLANEAFLPSVSAKSNVKLVGGKLVPVDPSLPGSITLVVQSPYILTRAYGKAAGVDTAEVSLDDGKTFKPIKFEDFSDEVGGNYRCLVKLSFKKELSSLRLEAIVQCNRGALPYLSPGKNTITVAVADPAELADNRLVVTYAYETGWRTKSYEQLADAGAELGRAHFASWSTTPTVVQKTFTAKELPASFDVDVPTPEGQYPVYPRMLFLRREILAPGSKPLSLPQDAQEPKRNPRDELKTLPNPFLVGIAPPPKKGERPVSVRKIALRAAQAVSKDGKVLENHFLKAKEGEHWVMLVGGELKELPTAKEIAAARLSIPVARGHDKAAVKLGVTELAAKFDAGKPYDFKNLTDVVGTTIVPRQPGETDYNPPKRFIADVTRAVKQIAAGETKFRGFALRVVPDRSIDEGYIGRIDLPADAVVELELDVYDRK